MNEADGKLLSLAMKLKTEKEVNWRVRDLISGL